MKLDALTTEEIREIMKQLLYKVEADKSVVDKHIQHRNIHRYNETYLMNFYNGYEYKICSIDENKVDISSESFITNLELTKFYKPLLESILSAKENELAV